MGIFFVQSINIGSSVSFHLSFLTHYITHASRCIFQDTPYHHSQLPPHCRSPQMLTGQTWTGLCLSRWSSKALSESKDWWAHILASNRFLKSIKPLQREGLCKYWIFIRHHGPPGALAELQAMATARRKGCSRRESDIPIRWRLSFYWREDAQAKYQQFAPLDHHQPNNPRPLHSHNLPSLSTRKDTYPWFRSSRYVILL